MREALADLVRSGLIYKIRGQGTFVAARRRDDCVLRIEVRDSGGGIEPDERFKRGSETSITRRRTMGTKSAWGSICR